MPVPLPTEKTIEWVLPYQQYQDQLVDQAALMLTLSGRVSETQQVLANQTTFRLRTPDLVITVGSPRFSTVALTAPDHETDLLRLSTFLAARGRSCRGQGDGSQDYLHQPAASHAEGSGVPCGGPGSAERP